MMEQLPQDIILSILSRLPIISLLQSMSVCRAWRRLIKDPLLASKHFSISHMADPTFIFQSNRPTSSYQLYLVDLSDHNPTLKKLHTSAFMFLVDSCNGLLCMRDSRGIYIHNPFTRNYLELPKLVNYPMEVGCIGFGFHPITNEYKVIRIVFRRQHVVRHGRNVNVDIQSRVHVLTIGDSEWRDLGTIPYDLTRPTPKAMAEGRLHWLSKNNMYNRVSLLISFDLKTEQFMEVPKPDCCNLDKKCFHDVMILRGCLSAIAYHDNEELEIWVMKEYGKKESWVKEFAIGTYLPKALKGDDIFHYNNARARFPNSSVRVLSSLKNGEILLEYRNRVIVVYNPQEGTFKEVTFPEMPHWFKRVVQVGSLTWIDTPINF